MISHDDKLPTFGKAADGKPENVSNGHLHTEIDTGKEYRYDEENATWYEQPASGGGGGGAVGGTPILLTLTPLDPQDPFLGEWSGATVAELDAAWTNGTPIRIHLLGYTITLAFRVSIGEGEHVYGANFIQTLGDVSILINGLVFAIGDEDRGTYRCTYFPLGT